MDKPDTFSLNRRHFLSYIALGTISLLTKDLLDPGSAIAATQESSNSNSILEKYHIFVPYVTARNGGKQTVNLRSGDICQIEIPSRTLENQEITIKGIGENENDILVVLHTLYDRQFRIADQVYQEIDKNTQFIEEASKAKCKSVYEQVENGEYLDDQSTLALLDYIISTSNLDQQIKERYHIASTNSRLLGIEQTIESALSKSNLKEPEKKQIRGTYAYVRAGEPVPNFKALTDIDSIVTNSALPLEIKQTYFLASTQSRALTVDFIIVKLIDESKNISDEKRKIYQSIYQRVREGKKVDDEVNLKSLDAFINDAEIPQNAKFIYSIAKDQELDTKHQNLDPQEISPQVAKDLLQDAKSQLNAASNGARIVPLANKILSTFGVETATGVSISSLSGAAATNATLAFLGGGSVAAGGLGMLGGLAVATGGAALIGAAGLLSIALVSEMDDKDRKNLGIAIGTGTIAGAVSVLAAWTAATALGVAGTLSGAAAITAIISALGGLSVITGGATLIASVTAWAIWSFLKGKKQRDQSVLHQLETRTYTLTEDPLPGTLGAFLKNKMELYNFEEGFSAPNIPLDKLSKALSKWVLINPDEKVMALIDTSTWNDAKGIIFTDNRVIWKRTWSGTYSKTYADLARFLNMETELISLLSDEHHRQELSKLEKLVYILSDDYANDFYKMQELVNLVSNNKILSDFVSNHDRNKISDLKILVDTLSDSQKYHHWSNLKNAVDVLNRENDLRIILPSQLASQLSDVQYREDLLELEKLVNMLSSEYDKAGFEKLVKNIATFNKRK
ncbi:hypothetical protein [Floridanema evergladense]|uniref:Uncharacterized protein n=1 Tax=Floridaenema evergladense BLCC-F167 TaxID=3153639 RepID=A0ABV4WP64_9CYAN